METGSNVLSALVTDEFSNVENVATKVRPPRFVSFTMELEPYSKKKAFALEILNEINLNVFEAETILKLYTMTQHVVIITGKRIICVDELRANRLGSAMKPDQPALVDQASKEAGVDQSGHSPDGNSSGR